jgi:hypothetical protein
LLTVGVIIATGKFFKARIATMLLAFLLLFQFVDSMPAFNSARLRFTANTQWSSPFTDAKWNSLSLNRKKLIVVPPLNNDEAGTWIAIADFAINHSMNTNSGHFSRYNENLYADLTAKYAHEIQSNNLDPEAIYIIKDEALWASLIGPVPKNQFRGTLNGFHVIVP